jgi:hypothetical protein
LLMMGLTGMNATKSYIFHHANKTNHSILA